MKGIGASAFSGDLHEHLQAFAALAARIEADPRGAYVAAAERAHLDPSVLRRRVRALSEWLGGDLLAGHGAKLRVTPRGREVADAALRVQRTVDELVARLDASRRALSVACTGTVTTELLAPALAAARARWPELAVTIRRAGVEQSHALLERREVGLAVVRAQAPPQGVARRRLLEDRLWAAIPAGDPLATRARLRTRDLARAPLIARGPRSATRRRVLEVLEPLGGRVQLEIEERGAALRYVALGLGVAFLSLVPGHALEVEGVVFKDVTARFPRSSFWGIWPEGRALSECERFLLDALAS
ncbi:MAG: LysR family transcriptional regulator [Planctomycetota bacterium]